MLSFIDRTLLNIGYLKESVKAAPKNKLDYILHIFNSFYTKNTIYNKN